MAYALLEEVRLTSGKTSPMYAQLDGTTIIRTSAAPPSPLSLGLPADAPLEDIEDAIDASGWVEVWEPQVRPADTAVTTYEPVVVVENGIAILTWEPRTATPTERNEANEEELMRTALVHLAELRTAVTQLETFTARTNADINTAFQQNPAAVLKDIVRPTVTIGRKLMRNWRFSFRILDATE
jgi:hypothetical protein